MIATDGFAEAIYRKQFTIRLGKFAQVGEPFRQLLMGETPKTALPHHATPVATTEETSLRVHQSPTAGNPPSGLDSPQRTGSTFRKI
ncbi:hypothetical protein [Nostoc sp. 106C]|uniref:hypothetical protein n=1 Tax=Nostoc sp. 106C TaxID=1932667 RepID=UPI000A393288|nr:hypothetical protein [Nostoc sp. 106C]OUL34828.1 hypothetical protein BV375_03330 [Nostoc sp. 106C]